MSPVDAAIVRRKLGHIMSSLDLLGTVADLSLDDYRSRVWERKGAERLLQEAIEAALDVNAHLISELGRDVPDDYFAGFLRLAELGVLDPALARALAPSAGLRTHLVHEYDTLDDAKVLAAIGTARDSYTRYIATIEAYLTRAGL